jgi:protein-disulfide isomerase
VQNISIDDDPTQGKTTAPVTVVMFTDFQCPACAATHPVLKKVLAEYADKVRFVVRDFPLVQIHQNAFQAALAANAANAQGKFFEYIEILYKNQTVLDAASLKKYADEAGLNQKQFALDLSQPKFADEVRKDMTDGKTYGISATPTIFVNGVKVRNLSAQAFKTAIENALRK